MAVDLFATAEGHLFEPYQWRYVGGIRVTLKMKAHKSLCFTVSQAQQNELRQQQQQQQLLSNFATKTTTEINNKQISVQTQQHKRTYAQCK